MTTILKATSTGQITLPAKWRRNFQTNQYIANIKDNSIEIIPLELDALKNAKEYTVFDAIRDNKGKGIGAKDLLNILKKID